MSSSMYMKCNKCVKLGQICLKKSEVRCEMFVTKKRVMYVMCDTVNSFVIICIYNYY